MKNNFLHIIIFYFFIYSCNLFSADIIREIEIKEDARKIISLPQLKTFFIQDPNIAKLLKTGKASDYVISGLSIGNTDIICRVVDGTETVLKITVAPRYWNTLKFLFADTPNISLDITDGHVIISGKVLQNSLMEKVKNAVALDKKRIINNVVLSHKDLLKRIDNYLKEEELDNLKVDVMDKTVYISGKIFDKSKRAKLLSVVESYSKPAGFLLNSSGIILSGSPLTVDIRFVTVSKGKDNNMGLTMEDIKYSMDFEPSMGHIYDSSATPNVVKKAGMDGTGSVTAAGLLRVQKINNAMKILFESKLATRSGETAKLQRGGTVYEKIEGVQAVDLRAIDYGFMVEVTPTMINAKTITADVNIQVSDVEQQNPLTIAKYSMIAKYTIVPGEVILINKMHSISDRVSEQGVPGLSDIPFIGYLFENQAAKDNNAHILLLLKISFQSSEKNAEEAADADKRFDHARDTETRVDMNISDTLVKDLIEAIQEE